jgi:triacylglycerol lipase
MLSAAACAGWSVSHSGELTMFNFENQTREHSDINAYWLGRASELAYHSDEEIQAEVVGKWGLNEVTILNQQAIKAFIATNDQVIIVAFRGTNNLPDIIDDLDIALVSGPGGHVHEGFLMALGYLWREIWRFIYNERQSRSLWITGHSLGGALAVLATARLRIEKQEPVNGCYTFGQPRVGDQDFCSHLDQDFRAYMYRYVNNNDIVPRIPKRIMGYADAGQFRYFDTAGQLRNDINWWDLLVDRLQGRLEDLLAPGTDGVADHSMSKYVACLDKALPEG